MWEISGVKSAGLLRGPETSSLCWSLSGEGGRRFKEKEVSDTERWRQEIVKCLVVKRTWNICQNLGLHNSAQEWRRGAGGGRACEAEAELVRKTVRGHPADGSE